MSDHGIGSDGAKERVLEGSDHGGAVAALVRFMEVGSSRVEASMN
jgi:hypothetical protein